MRFISGLSVAALVGTFFLALPAQALEEPFTRNMVSASGQLGYGLWLHDSDINGYGFFLGGSGGYTLPFNLYLGGRFDYHLGEKEDLLGDSFVRGSSWLLHLEAGYDLGLTKNVVLRPKVGLGPMQLVAKACLEFLGGRECDSSTATAFSMAMGVEAPIELGPVYLSPETRFNFYFGDAEANGFLFGLHVGAVF